jgi:hypothetical protein
MKGKLWGRALALVGACVGVLALTGAPSASASSTCAEIQGAGSSLQNIAQNEVWAPLWSTMGSPGCTTTTKVKYFESSSGSGKEQWGDKTGAFALNSEQEKFPAFIGSDTGASTSQESEMETAAGGETGIVTIPVEQSAISVPVSLPVGCEPKAVGTPPTVTGANLSRAWETGGTGKTFSELFSGLTGKCSSTPTFIARSKNSGTTAGFKRFLGCYSEAGTEPECFNESEKTPWAALNASTGESETPNWPSTTKIDTIAGTGGELAQKVMELPGTSGYADLADARSQGFLTKEYYLLHYLIDETLKELYWSVLAKVNSNGSESNSPEEPSNGESNCTKSKYFEEGKAITAKSSWGVSRQFNPRQSSDTTYGICTLTYDLVWQNYTKPKSMTYSTAEGNAVINYEKWIVGAGAGEGQKALAALHYGELPGGIQSNVETALANSGTIIP